MLVWNFYVMAFLFYLIPLPGKSLICLRLQKFHFQFHAAGFPPHLTGHLFWILFHISHFTIGDSFHLCKILFHLCHLLIHIFLFKSPHLRHPLFLHRKYLCCLSAPSIYHLFLFLKFCIHLVFHFSDLAVGITSRLCHCLRWILLCLSQLHLQTMHFFPSVLKFSLHHYFQYCNLFLARVNGTLVIKYLMVCLGFKVLDMVLQICYSPLISFLSKNLGPFVLVVILVLNWQIHICVVFSAWQTPD